MTSGAGIRLSCLALLPLVILAEAANAETPPAPTVSIAGTIRFSKTAPIFLQLLSLDAQGREVVVRSQVIALDGPAVERRSLAFRFADLAPGRYALKAFQDENGNGRIDIGVFGPKEPWSTYRLARPKLRPPRFDEMAFEAASDVDHADLLMR